MGNLKDLSADQLEEMVRERKKWIEIISDFVFALVVKDGKVITREEDDWSTHVERELSVGDFVFMLSTGESQMGGETISISFNSKKVFEIQSTCSLDECDVMVFESDSLVWLTSLDRLMTEKRLILEIKEEMEKKKAERLRMRLALAEEKKFFDLRKEAERIML